MSPENIITIETRLAWLTRLLGLGVLALVAVTWRLWTPQELFPRVPLFRWAPPDWWDWTSLGLITIGGLGLLAATHRQVRIFATTLAAGLALAFVCDQHRLQPWAWQFFILALLLALADKPLIWTGWQWLTISIYFYSALSKFNVEFLDSIGHAFARNALGGLFSTTTGYPPGPSAFYGMNYAFMWIFPVGELGVALLLAIPVTCKWGMWAAIAMHSLLLQILGPYGLNHSSGVLLWNVFFIAQAAVLFMPSQRFWSGKSLTLPYARQSVCAWPNRIAQLLLAWILLWPATHIFGFCDAWLAWAVYVSPSPFASIDVRMLVFDHLPELRKLQIIQPQETDHELPVGQWSLRTVQAPAYPNVRNMVAVSLELSERFNSDHVRLIVSRRPNATIESDLQSAHEIHAYARRFWFNAYPTSMYRRTAREKVMKDDG